MIMIFFYAIFFVTNLEAQETAADSFNPKFHHFLDSLTRNKVGKKFSMHGKYNAIDGKVIDFDNLKHNAYLLFGEDGCAPCVKQLEVIIELSKEYAKIDFTYFYMGSKESIKEQLEDINESNFYSTPNFFIVDLTNDVEIRKSHTIFCYPTQYCIDKQEIIKSYDIGYKEKNFLITQRLCEIN